MNGDVLNENCPSRQVLSLIADKWTVLILHVLNRNTYRFSEINKKIDGISQKMLTHSLRKLERDGIVKRIVFPQVPPKVEYKLTNLGLSLITICEEMSSWAELNYPQILQARNIYDKQNSLA